MTKSFSIYLDLIRFSASFLVVIDHMVSSGFFSTTTMQFVPQLGREAVIVFFVLSGFVISYVVDTKESNLRDYTVARMARMYSVALPILLLGFLTYLVTQSFVPSIESHYQIDNYYIYIPFHLLFMGELWTLSEVPPWMTSYWSLSYEVWYYIFFASIFFLRGITRIIIASIVFTIMGYKLWLLLPVWFSGVLLYKVGKNITVSNATAWIGFCCTVIALVLYKVFDLDYQIREFTIVHTQDFSWSLGSADRFLSDYLVMLIIWFNFLFASRIPFSFSSKAANTIRTLASYTFTLYLLHFVALSFWISIDNTYQDNVLSIVGVLTLVTVSTWFVGKYTEHKKSAYVRFLNKSFDTLAATRRFIKSN